MFEDIEKSLKVEFKNKDLLKTAFIHRSYLNEHSDEKLPHNERLEFLGDSVLGFIVSEYLFNEYPDKPEGDLTNYRSSIVNARTLSAVASKLNLGKYLLLSRGEEATGGRERQYLLANTFEAFLGALYLDQGIEPCRQLISETVLTLLPSIISQKLYKDYKSGFQEASQEKVNLTPIYQVLEELGPDHDRTFKVGVFLKDKKVGEGVGKSKQQAEQEAARVALENIDQIS